MKTRQEWEDDICRGAVLFTVLRHQGRGKYDRRTFDTFTKAVNDAAPDGRAMLYVTDNREQGCMVAPKDWERVRSIIPMERR